MRHCVPYKGLHPLRRLCGYPCPLRMGNNLFAQTVSHPKPKTQHTNCTACPKDRRYFLSASKGGIYDANNREAETGDRRCRKEAGAGAQQAPAAAKPEILLREGRQEETGTPPHYQRGCRGEHCTAGKGFERNGVLCFYGKGFCFAGSQGFVDGGGQCTQSGKPERKGISIALFHFHVTQIKRSAGQSAVASAAYRSGEKLHSEYYGEDSDYTRKGGVLCSEILLPPHAPPSFAERQTLWNEVEKAERGKKAQLAYSFDIALQNEFSMQENIDLARQFLSDNFVSRGMIVDFAVHQPDKENGGISNPHFHVMCPIRPIKPDGRWGNKQRREYVLDEHGERVLDEAGNYVFNAVPTTDWGKPETLEAWRQAWAEMCNQKFAEKRLDCRIDHRSFARQGVEQIPTQHEGPTVRAMEAKGIRTDKGDLNRFIRKTNALLREAKEKIAALIGWLKDVKAELAKPQPPTLNDLLALHCANRNKGAYSNKAKNANLQRYAEAFSFLQSKNLYTVDDLETTLHAMQDKIDTLKKSASSKQARIKEVDELLRMVDYYKSGKPAADKLKFIRFEKSRQKYKAEHNNELRTFYMAERKLKPYFKDGKLPITAWRREREQLEQEYKDIQTELSPLHADAKKLWAIHYNIYKVQHEQERQNTELRQKKQEIEH